MQMFKSGSEMTHMNDLLTGPRNQNGHCKISIRRPAITEQECRFLAKLLSEAAQRLCFKASVPVTSEYQCVPPLIFMAQNLAHCTGFISQNKTGQHSVFQAETLAEIGPKL